MKKNSLLFVLLTLLYLSCKDQSKTEETNTELPRIAIAGIGIESSTFSPAQTEEAAFHAELVTPSLVAIHFLMKGPILENVRIGYLLYLGNPSLEAL
ncbi:M81 family metallopeptidase [Maribacter litopenaei]|uniref:M81 family metallopeptidase n=1 Tax=Maribacter litopenaei TaxID=2976127 RepID=A0ABY5Y4L2_9FLAO|nr:M81 family metallopeptidase [Maribacter litopenaei]UWX53809.1 M81 family metallopeptidase [Maribacter litopenaei]